ncbi:MAG: ABC transporter ATP-binding protein [Rhizobacter sp.]|nr:ABC transporter ATP-binding protein [Chlorobiales bacterium]
MIELSGITKYYSAGFVKTYVLRDVSLRVAAGEFVSIMGPSGSGKSTLLHILGMLDAPESGSYRFLGEDVFKLSERQRSELHKSHIGFVFQSYHLLDDLTVYENLETPLLYKNIKPSERKSLVADVLDRFGIVAKKDLFPNQLSGGQQQQVAIARAVITSPKLILADEPTGNLNSQQSDDIMQLFQKLGREGTTIVQVTHSEKNAACASRVVHLLDGRARQD